MVVLCNHVLFHFVSMATITTEEIAGKKEELTKKVKQYEEKIAQWKKEFEALEITERLLTGNAESTTDKKRKEIGDSVLRAIATDALHYKLIALKVSADLGKEIKPNAMYNFLNRAIERNEIPIQKMEEGKYARTKGAEDVQRVEAATLQE